MLGRKANQGSLIVGLVSQIIIVTINANADAAAASFVVAHPHLQKVVLLMRRIIFNKLTLIDLR